MVYKIILFFISFVFTQESITTKEFSIYKSNNDKYIDFSDIFGDLNGTYVIQLIAVKDLQFNKKRKT